MLSFYRHCNLFMIDPKIIQIRLIFILRCQTGVCQIALFIIPFLQSTIIKHLQIIIYDKRNDIIFQTFLKHDQSADASIAILEWMYPLKLHMKI